MRLLQKTIYYLCYLTYKVMLKLSHLEIKKIWYRNSFCFNYWVFLKSDIDITLVFEKPSRKIIEQVAYSHSLFHRFLPVIGEFVIFSEFHKSSLIECINAYELKRDPVLIKKYELEKKGTYYEKIIFLNKFIAANWSKKKIDWERPEKIKFVNEHLELGNNKTISDLIDELSSLLGVDNKQFRDEYIQELNNQEEHVVYHEFTISNLIYALFYNNLCYLKPVAPLNISERNIIEQVVLWELWGAFSYQTTVPQNDFNDHFKRIFDQLDQITNKDFAIKAEGLLKNLVLN